jgi:uncharacterized protein
MSRDEDLRFILDARIPMRDGVELSADIYLPAGQTTLPAILTRTPYDNANPDEVRTAQYFARHGFAFVSGDVRGRGDSDGRFVPFRGEGPDGYDTVEWIARQPWCNGRVGMMGASYACSTQWWAALEQPPHLVTLVSTAVSGRLVQSPYWRGKIHAQFLMWLQRVGGRTMQPGVPGIPDGPAIDWARILDHRPLREAVREMGRASPAWEEWIDHADDASYWEKESHFRDYAEVDLPVLHLTGWYDGSLVGELELFDGMVRDSPARDRQHLIIGPWDHRGTRRPESTLRYLDFGGGAVVDIDDIHRRWFDHWLRGIEDEAFTSALHVSLFTIGRNTWRQVASWPLSDSAPHILYLHSAGGANSDGGDGRLGDELPVDEPVDSYVYDPADPTPSAPTLEDFVVAPGPLDHLDRCFVESRHDVLVYTSDTLSEEIEVTGTPIVRLWASTDAVDTDFAATLCDVDATGRSTIVAECLVRSAYRTGDGICEPVPPGEVAAYQLQLNPTSLVFGIGHRIRVAIMSAEFPSYNRNPNTGAAVGDDGTLRLATQRIHHTSTSPSHIELPTMRS